MSLLIPALLVKTSGASDDDIALELPALETWLARAEPQVPTQTRGLEATIFTLFNIDHKGEGDLPIAATTRALDMGVIDQGWWLRADPVHLRPERDRLILIDSSQLQLTQSEANRLAAEIMETYAADGWLLKAARPGRWYVKPPRASKIITTPLPDVVGKDIHPYLPKGKDGKSWHTILNEIQILLHTAVVNVEREHKGLPPINSLWFWGSGRLPKIKRVSWAQVWSQEPVSLALARLSDTPSAALPANFSDWLSQARGGAHLVVLDHGRALVQYGGGQPWWEFLRRLEQDWIAPTMQALKDGALEMAMLYTDTGPAFELNPRYARRWWRRRVPIDNYP